MDNIQAWWRHGEKGSPRHIWNMCGFQTVSEQECTEYQRPWERKSLGKICCSSLTPLFCLPLRFLTKRVPKWEFLALDQSSVAFSVVQIQETLNSYFQLEWVWVHFASCYRWLHLTTESRHFMQKFLRVAWLLGHMFQWTHWSSDFLP